MNDTDNVQEPAQAEPSQPLEPGDEGPQPPEEQATGPVIDFDSALPPAASTGPVLSVGRIVHYFGDNGEAHAAMVAGIEDERPVLQVFPTDRSGSQLVRPEGRGMGPGCWDWPPKV